MTDHHRHEWTPQPDAIATEQWRCAECEAVSATCIVTDTKRGTHPTTTALLICQGCLDYEHRVLDDIAQALGHWQHQPRSLVPAIRYDRDRTDTGARPDTGFEDPGDVVQVLWSWADAWAGHLGIEPAGHVVQILKSGLMWAAHNPGTSGWSEYRTEVRTLRHHARRLSHLLPQRQAGPCPHCGAEPGSVVRRWAHRDWEPRRDGLADEVECLGCAMVWEDRGHYLWVGRTTIGALPLSHPDALVTLEDAREQVFRTEQIPAATWRSWLFRDAERAEAGEPRLMPEQGHDERGKALYRLGDLRALVAGRADESRRGRRAG